MYPEAGDPLGSMMDEAEQEHEIAHLHALESRMESWSRTAIRSVLVATSVVALGAEAVSCRGEPFWAVSVSAVALLGFHAMGSHRRRALRLATGIVAVLLATKEVTSGIAAAAAGSPAWARAFVSLVAGVAAWWDTEVCASRRQVQTLERMKRFTPRARPV